MENEIRRVKVKKNGQVEIYVADGQGGGCTICLEPGMKISRWPQNNKFYIKTLKE